MTTVKGDITMFQTFEFYILPLFSNRRTGDLVEIYSKLLVLRSSFENEGSVVFPSPEILRSL
jgi:hypothetical protein